MEPHATMVAGVIIRKNPENAVGVAPDAKLYSSALQLTTAKKGYTEEQFTEVLQIIAAKNGDDIVAINASTGLPFGKLDGSSTMTKGTDYVAAKHDTLVVRSGPNDIENVLPGDAYNVLTVAEADIMLGLDKEPIGAETAYWSAVGRTKYPVSEGPEATRRVLTHLIAPSPFSLPNVSNTGAPADDKKTSGDSFAAPLATGTVALLQEYARKPASNIAGNDYKQEEVMKAVLINSADKVRDLLPDSAGKGMSRTVRMKDLKSTWLDSPAADIPKNNEYNTTDPANQARQVLPLDLQMGAGFLNASRALEQLKGKQFAPGNDTTGRIGWDYNSITLAAGAAPTEKRYKLPTLKGGGYLSATLTWDRNVTLTTDVNNNGKYDDGDTLTAQQLANLDLYIVPRGRLWQTRSGLPTAPSTTWNTSSCNCPRTTKTTTWSSSSGA
ncbi:MAG: S8 family serine peptidase [Planctomycetia bacterium]|nr:S8 family serine peptidase [Planctomycetia bacterium]